MVKGDTLNISWTAGTQVTPFASVNGSTQPSDFHPGVKEKSGVRSIAVQFASNGTTIRDIDRSEGLYENAFKTRNTAFNNSITGTAITFPAPTSTSTTSQGWLLKIETKNAAGDVVARTKQVSALVTDMTGLLTNLGTSFTGTWTAPLTPVASLNSASGPTLPAPACSSKHAPVTPSVCIHRATSDHWAWQDLCG